MRALLLVALCASLILAHSQARAEAQEQVDVGKKYFAVCSACHSTDGSAKAMGPTLKGILNRQAATDAGFKGYSIALKESKITWTEQELEAYLSAPGKRVPRTTMMVNVADPARRKALIAYMKTLK